jgi:hypothetical protein
MASVITAPPTMNGMSIAPLFCEDPLLDKGGDGDEDDDENTSAVLVKVETGPEVEDDVTSCVEKVLLVKVGTPLVWEDVEVTGWLAAEVGMA